jgi:ribosomal protein L7/L12
MHATEIKCPRCFAPVDPSRGAISTCRFCGTTIAINAQPPAQPIVAHEHVGGSLVVFLEDAGNNKISVIKAVREGTGLGLKEAKDLVERAPCIIAQCPDPIRAENFRKKLAAAGARVR